MFRKALILLIFFMMSCCAFAAKSQSQLNQPAFQLKFTNDGIESTDAFLMVDNTPLHAFDGGIITWGEISRFCDFQDDYCKDDPLQVYIYASDPATGRGYNLGWINLDMNNRNFRIFHPASNGMFSIDTSISEDRHTLNGNITKDN